MQFYLSVQIVPGKMCNMQASYDQGLRVNWGSTRCQFVVIVVFGLLVVSATGDHSVPTRVVHCLIL